jgi:hypothetical protein
LLHTIRHDGLSHPIRLRPVTDTVSPAGAESRRVSFTPSRRVHHDGVGEGLPREFPFMRNFFATLAALALVLVALPAHAGYLYRSSIDNGNNFFARYDTVTQVWTQLNNVVSSAQMAVDNNGDLFSYNQNTNTINLYDPNADSWSIVMSGPAAASTTAISNAAMTAASC